jgi:hypothetical protein
MSLKHLILLVLLAIGYLYSFIGINLSIAWLTNFAGTLGMILIPILVVVWVGVLIFLTVLFYKSLFKKLNEKAP